MMDTRSKDNRLAWLSKQNGCMRCGEQSLDLLEVDHVDPSTKVSSALWHWSEDKRQKELAKCQVLCHDCHVKKTKIDIWGEPSHGTMRMYNQYKCRCDPCKQAGSEYYRQWRKRNKHQ